MRGPQVESLVSLSWCIRQGTRGEGDGDADYLPPRRLPYCEDETRVHALIDSQLLEARQNFTATSLSLLRNHRKRQQLTALLKSLSTIKTLVSHFLFSLS